MSDTSFHDPLFEGLFLACLARSLTPESTVLALALPGNAFVATLRRPEAGLNVVTALSSDLIETYAGFAECLVAHPDARLVAAAADGVLWPGETRTLGAGFVAPSRGRLKTRSLSGLIAGIRNPALLYLDCDSDRGGLLGPALETILERGCIVWMDVRAQDTAATLERLLGLPGQERFGLFGLDRQRGFVDLHRHGGPTQLHGVLLVPQWRWNDHGLHRLVAATEPGGQMSELRVPLLVPRSRGVSDRTLDIIAGTRPVPDIPETPEKIFLAAADHLFGRHVRVDPIPGEEDARGLNTQALHRVGLVFVPPVTGEFELRVILAWEPGHDLRLRTGTRSVAMVWSEDWYHLRSQGHFVAEQANRPAIFEISHTGPARELGLMIKGVELDYIRQPATGTRIPVCQF